MVDKGYGKLHLKINDLLQKKKISKNKLCSDLSIPRGNFNKYCRDDFKRLDANFICKLCFYFNCDIDELIEYKK